jgi:tRNA-2-methylthio-N6-dimethylallyladenosine synthase
MSSTVPEQPSTIPLTPLAAEGGVYISTYGCQMNVNDSERMYALLENANYIPVEKPEDASIIIINSCSVREKPVHKVHSEMGTYRKLKESNPALKIGVGGCVGQQEKSNLLRDIPLLDFVFGPDNIDALPNIIKELRAKDGSKKRHRESFAKFEHGQPYDVETLVRNPGVSTFVNITKGCDNFCTFCVVPFTRGRLRSRPMKDIIGDINILTRRGVREVTLLGQNVNSYESACGADFGKLLETVATDTDLWRLRFTTSHPKDFHRDLVETMQKHRNKICDYIHLPVQSGNSEILHRMNRGYTREEYLDKVAMIKEVMPGVVLSTDIIVGFPGETEDQYQDTLSLVEEVGYDSIFAFSYSPRPLTKAAKYTEQVDPEVSARRLNDLLLGHRVRSIEDSKKHVGQTYEVLIEKFDDRAPDMLMARSTQNKIVHFAKPEGFPDRKWLSRSQMDRRASPGSGDFRNAA